MSPTTPSDSYGVHSEVGRLRKVLVCRPGLAHRRLTPTNADDLLFDDVMWVENAQRDHADFVNKLTQRGVEVVELHDVLAQALAVHGARDWLLDRKITANRVGLGLVDGTRGVPRVPAAGELSEYVIGGLATRTCPRTSARGTPRWFASRPGRGSTSCRRSPTRCTRATPPAGSTAG